MNHLVHLVRAFACAACVMWSGSAWADQTYTARLVLEAKRVLDAHYGSTMQLHRASSLLQKALADNKDDPDAYVQAARLTIKGGELRSLRLPSDSRRAYGELLDKALALNPNHAKARILKAEYYHLQGDFESERAELDKAKRLGTDDAWLQLGYARHHLKLRARDEAIRLYHEVRARGPQADRSQNNAYVEALNGIARLLAPGGNHGALGELFNQMRAARDPRDAWAASGLAGQLVYAGMFTDAITLSRESLLAMDHGLARMTLVAALYGNAAHLIAKRQHDHAAVLVAEASSYEIDREVIMRFYDFSNTFVAKLRPKLEALVR